ncbi:MAG: hypothetical protein RLZZ244_2570 [Verrucomicrobiota bacterium]|jgi:hypothetical protein
MTPAMPATSPRRHFLQTATALIALPFLESLGFKRFASASERAAAARPKRLIFVGFGWGVTEESWYPKASQPGAEYPLPPGLKPLERHKADFSVVQGLTNKYSQDGHAGSTFWLTGANQFGEPGQSFHNSVSADQVAARHLSEDTRFAALSLDCGAAAANSGHGQGLSLSWDVRGKPIGGPRNPLEAFQRLFAKDNTPLEERRVLLAERRSVLDHALESARDLQRGLSRSDCAKLDEYFQGIRDIETRLSRDEKWLGVAQPDAPIAEPKPGLAGFEEIRLMYDLMVAALQTDCTRVLTYRQPVSTLLTSLDIKMDSHTMSHYHGPRGEKLAVSQRRDEAQSQLLAHLIDRLKSTQEPDGGSLFDHTTVVYGSNIRTGHSLDNCPTLLAGRGAGIRLGQNLVAPKDTPLCNAWLTLLQGCGVPVERHGDSTGVVPGLRA